MIRGCHKRARRGLLSWGQAAVGGCQTAEQGGRSNPHSWTVATATVCSVAATLSPGTHLLSSASAPKPFEFRLHRSKGSRCLVVRAATSSRWRLPIPALERLGFLWVAADSCSDFPLARPLWQIRSIVGHAALHQCFETQW